MLFILSEGLFATLWNVKDFETGAVVKKIPVVRLHKEV